MSDAERTVLLDDAFRGALADLGGVVDGAIPLRRVVGVPRDGSSVRYEVRGPRGFRFVARFYLDPGAGTEEGFSYDLRSAHGPLVGRGSRRFLLRPERAARVLVDRERGLVPERPESLPATTETVARTEALVTALDLARGASTYYDVRDGVLLLDPDGLFPRLSDAVTGGYRAPESELLPVAALLEGLAAGAPVEWAARRALRGSDS